MTLLIADNPSCDIEQIEKIQRRATKLVISLKKIAIQGTSTPSKFIHTKI